MEKTRIEWAESTWNPVTGCYHECKYCYARRMAARFGDFLRIDGSNIKTVNGRNGELCVEVAYKTANPYPEKFTPTLHKQRLRDYEKKRGRNIFVCSMADLLGDWVPDAWIDAVFEECERAPQHNYLFLTKNPDRYISLDMNGRLLHGANMWYGLTVSDKKQAEAAMITADMTEEAGAFLSIEPILEDVLTDDLKTIIANFVDWVIIGAETGNRKGKVIPERKWIENIVELCREWEKPVFMKDSLSEVWGEQLIREWPEELRPGSRR